MQEQMTAADYQKHATSESGEQQALIARCECHYAEYPELRYLFAIPNGGSRHKAEAANLKRQGVKPGVPDLCLPVARLGFHALFIEMKSDSGKLSTEQRAWQSALRRHGNLAVICYSQESAWEILMEYLNS